MKMGEYCNGLYRWVLGTTKGYTCWDRYQLLALIPVVRIAQQCTRSIWMNTKNRIEKIARRTLAKRIFLLITSGMYNKREYKNRKYIFKALPDWIYIWFSLLYIALPDLVIYYI